jgi:energy-coupling factor transporter ATP-binding protein EcfA2
VVAESPEPPLFDPGPPNRLAIAWIEVDRLHGRFTYRIEVGPSPGVASTGGLFAVSEQRLTLLYGNNGTGKTSLLRLVFHALSAGQNRGHRNALLRTRFGRFAVCLTDGTTISYTRSDGRIEGPYRAMLQTRGDQDPITWDFAGGERHRQLTWSSARQVVISSGFVDFDDAALLGYEDADDEQRFLGALARLGLNPVFLGDSRAVTADILDRDDGARRTARDTLLHGGRPSELDDLVHRQRDLDVTASLELVRRYLSQLGLSGTQAGSQRVDSVYVNVAKAIILHASKVGRRKKTLVPELRDRVAQLGERAQRFYDYGLLPEFPASALQDVLASAQDTNGPVLQQVLNPYLEGLVQRMDALEPGLQAVASFVDALNSFLEDKRVEFRLGDEGLRIVDETTKDELDASALSSGEKQIVLLFSDIVALQETTRLFIIDEPELSLNPEWQRKLMPSLLRVTSSSEMQLLAATHSIEIMAKYRRRIRRLASTQDHGRVVTA